MPLSIHLSYVQKCYEFAEHANCRERERFLKPAHRFQQNAIQIQKSGVLIVESRELLARVALLSLPIQAQRPPSAKAPEAFYPHAVSCACLPPMTVQGNPKRLVPESRQPFVLSNMLANSPSPKAMTQKLVLAGLCDRVAAHEENCLRTNRCHLLSIVRRFSADPHRPNG